MERQKTWFAGSVLRHVVIAIVSGVLVLGAISLPPTVLGEDADDLKAKEAEAKKVFDAEMEDIIKKLPSSAVVLILDCVVDTNVAVPKLSDDQMKRAEEKLSQQFEKHRQTCQANKAKMFLKRGLKVVDRNVMKEAEKEIVLSQTGVVDSKTSVQFGKATGATHIVIEKDVATLHEDSLNLAASITVTEIQSALLVGIASTQIDMPIKSDGQSEQAQVACNLTGRWTSNFGPMEIRQNGDSISGQYLYQGVTKHIPGSLTGRVSGGVVEWEWQQANNDRGFGRWDIRADCMGLLGKWGRRTKDFDGKVYSTWIGDWNAQKLAQ